MPVCLDVERVCLIPCRGSLIISKFLKGSAMLYECNLDKFIFKIQFPTAHPLLFSCNNKAAVTFPFGPGPDLDPSLL